MAGADLTGAEHGHGIPDESKNVGVIHTAKMAGEPKDPSSQPNTKEYSERDVSPQPPPTAVYLDKRTTGLSKGKTEK